MIKKVLLFALVCFIAFALASNSAAEEELKLTEDEKKITAAYVDEHGIDKVKTAFEHFWSTAGNSHQDIFEWVATTPDIPSTASDWALKDTPTPMQQAENDVESPMRSVSEPRTDGQGLQMPQNNPNKWLDWAPYKRKPNDPAYLFEKPLGFKTFNKNCLDKRKWYYRTYDGSCNWVDDDNWQVGMSWKPYQRDTPHGKDYEKVVKSERKYVPYSRPIDKPNPRILSTTFFQNASGISINHTPILTGLIEFIIHDVSWSETGTDTVSFPIPCGDDLNKGDPCDKDATFTFNVTQTKIIKGVDDIKRTINSATSWVDGSQIYGNDEVQNKRLRSGINGKLKVQRGVDGEYISYNPKGPKGWFDGGDNRVNQDWYITAIQTLWVRDHNRICDILANKNPTWNDEQLFLTAREVITCKMFLIALAYMKGYFIMPEMSKKQPINDNLQLVRLAYGKNILQINPMMQFGELGLAPNGKGPAVASDEMSVGYRFHDLIPEKVSLVDSNNNTIKSVDFLDTIYTPAEFMKHGIDAVLRGAVGTTLPGFHSGVQRSLRDAKFNLGDPNSKKPFDIAMWSILRERSRGLPTFNEYFRYWNNADSNHLKVNIRTRFADFTSNVYLQQKLAEIYDTPDQVDLVIGLQLDEELFPGMQIPKSFVLVSLLSLYSLGISDRHGPLFNLVVCFDYPNTPQDCRTTNVLQDLLWKRNNLAGSPNARLLDKFWIDEIDYEHQGVLALWRLVAKNTNVKCLPMNPLFTAHYQTDYKAASPYNPVVCTEDDWAKAWKKTKM